MSNFPAKYRAQDPKALIIFRAADFRVHQGAEIPPSLAMGEPDRRGEAGPEAAVPGQQASEQSLPIEGAVRLTLGLQKPWLGASILQELERRSDVATFAAVPEVCRDDRGPLRRHRDILPRGE